MGILFSWLHLVLHQASIEQIMLSWLLLFVARDAEVVFWYMYILKGRMLSASWLRLGGSDAAIVVLTWVVSWKDFSGEKPLALMALIGSYLSD